MYEEKRGKILQRLLALVSIVLLLPLPAIAIIGPCPGGCSCKDASGCIMYLDCINIDDCYSQCWPSGLTPCDDGYACAGGACLLIGTQDPVVVPDGTQYQWSDCLARNFDTCDDYCQGVGSTCSDVCPVPGRDEVAGGHTWSDPSHCAELIPYGGPYQYAWDCSETFPIYDTGYVRTRCCCSIEGDQSSGTCAEQGGHWADKTDFCEIGDCGQIQDVDGYCCGDDEQEHWVSGSAADYTVDACTKEPNSCAWQKAGTYVQEKDLGERIGLPASQSLEWVKQERTFNTREYGKLQILLYDPCCNNPGEQAYDNLVLTKEGETTNLIQNPSFETVNPDGSLPGWTHGCGEAVVSSDAHQGSNSLVRRGSGGCLSSQEVVVAPFTSYKLIVWTKHLIGNDAGAAVIDLGEYWTNDGSEDELGLDKCDDNVDNDCDGQKDCNDMDCCAGENCILSVFNGPTAAVHCSAYPISYDCGCTSNSDCTISSECHFSGYKKYYLRSLTIQPEGKLYLDQGSELHIKEDLLMEGGLIEKFNAGDDPLLIEVKGRADFDCTGPGCRIRHFNEMAGQAIRLEAASLFIRGGTSPDLPFFSAGPSGTEPDSCGDPTKLRGLLIQVTPVDQDPLPDTYSIGSFMYCASDLDTNLPLNARQCDNGRYCPRGYSCIRPGQSNSPGPNLIMNPGFESNSLPSEGGLAIQSIEPIPGSTISGNPITFRIRTNKPATRCRGDITDQVLDDIDMVIFTQEDSDRFIGYYANPIPQDYTFWFGCTNGIEVSQTKSTIFTWAPE
ncbi:MAG: hypothetical protein KJ709_01550 [Nanoarchaeota archaeon]|nr:hypothetical protein [Nanoarchaeota archaeon]